MVPQKTMGGGGAVEGGRTAILCLLDPSVWPVKPDVLFPPFYFLCVILKNEICYHGLSMN